MSKTAMQIVYEFIEVGEKQYGHQRDALLSELVKRKTELLDKEKEQIINAWEEGELFGERVERDGMTYKQVMERRNEFIKNQNI